MKCKTCKVHEEVCKSEVPACCKWFLDNVAIGDKSVEDCTDYEPVEDDDDEREDFEDSE